VVFQKILIFCSAKIPAERPNLRKLGNDSKKEMIEVMLQGVAELAKLVMNRFISFEL